MWITPPKSHHQRGGPAGIILTTRNRGKGKIGKEMKDWTQRRDDISNTNRRKNEKGQPTMTQTNGSI